MHLFADILPQTAETIMFYVFALMAAASALTLVVSRNIVRTAVCLLFTLMGVAGLYFLLHAEFLAAVQLVVYAGGTLILIIFGVMLTSKSPFSRFDPKAGEVVVALSVGMVLLVALILGIANFPFPQSQAEPTGKYPVLTLGQALLGDYLIPFEIASVLLLVVMIGAAYLAKARRRDGDELNVDRTAASKTMRQWS
jgi:NADH:ubiquinone oxidoreductase subunit 6 (subunit J)